MHATTTEPASAAYTRVTSASSKELRESVASESAASKALDDPLDAHPTRRHRFLCWRLSRRRWWMALGASVLLVALAAFLVVWFVVIDAIFQKHTNDVQVALQAFDIVKADPTPGATALGVSMRLRFTYDLPARAKTDATQVQLAFAGKTFAALELPALSMPSGRQEYDVELAGETQVTNAATFEALAAAAITQKTLVVDARARISAHAAGLSRGGLKFERSLTFNGLNNFASPPSEINRMTVETCSLSGMNLSINATVDNVAHLGLDGIGALNLSLYHEQRYLGFAVSGTPALGIPRGRTAQLFNVTIASAATQVGAISRMVQSVAFGRAQFFLTGDNALATQIDLFKTPLRSLNVSIVYESGLERVAFASACNLLTLLGLV